ncbi:hypothetical protein [Streptomyces sp. NRRL F-525]|uniref:hypothetical protein n=1 Tax=Streptomyces sp. NRRL F-525 TaxID=1463861 RepID=UPI00131C2C7B|nr:hypothetical protein [Streptomyces sp. NRRL F-525]
MDEATAEGGSDTARALDRAALADRVVVMDDGRVVERGRPDKLRSAVCGQGLRPAVGGRGTRHRGPGAIAPSRPAPHAPYDPALTDAILEPHILHDHDISRP